MRVIFGQIEGPARRRAVRVHVFREDGSPRLNITARVTKRQRTLCARSGCLVPSDSPYLPLGAVSAQVFGTDDDGTMLRVTTAHCPRCYKQLWSQTEEIGPRAHRTPLPPEAR